MLCSIWYARCIQTQKIYTTKNPTRVAFQAHPNGAEYINSILFSFIMYSVFQIFSVYSIVVFNCHIQLYMQLSRYLVFLYSFTSVSRTIFLIGRTLPGDTDSSSKPIARNSLVSDRSAPSSPQIPAHLPYLCAASTTI